MFNIGALHLLAYVYLPWKTVAFPTLLSRKSIILTFDGFSYAQRYCIFIHNKCMNIDTITTQGVSTMKNNLPPFIEIYRA
ncbi:MAG: hypothetical protein E6895_02510, partial [Klebsiella sp.]|nr:hypothetical protein [Klebsiella sp.]